MSPDPEHWNAAALEHLTGPMRGKLSWITARAVDVCLRPDKRLVFTETHPDEGNPDAIARFRRVGSTYEIEAVGTQPVWLNGKPLQSAALGYGDVIEFGETGPLSRFRLYDDSHGPGLTVGEILDDVLCYVRTSRRPLHRKLGFAAADLVRRLARDTSIFFRALVVLSLGLLAYTLYQQHRADQLIQARLETGTVQIDAVATALADARRESIRPADLAALQSELGERLTTNAERLRTLEARSGASRRVISTASPSVVFLQGGYSLRHKKTGEMLRHVVGQNGMPVHLPNGQPFLSLSGTGDIAEVQFNGTGFVLAGRDLLITNRHVAEPWGTGVRAGGEEIEPVMTRFIAYFPGQPTPVTLTVLAMSDSMDLAALTMDRGAEVPGLEISQEAPAPGDEVIVMGYPTGLKSMLAQTGSTFVQELKEAGETGFWAVAGQLAAANLIAPLASRGIVGQATDVTVVYDAETTHGGSGGPVLNASGEVVAVNTAIIPEFGGSNLGVPAAHISSLIEALTTAPVQ
ncbi:trypsin-like peptidase domain-containing protein [Sedimentitalea sp.]|uniref:trypsin-like peptidase domain-containing protein n=1 Tax=Sedimentitalea sp. TaxID=2048915 RepID=UPI003298D4E2